MVEDLSFSEHGSPRIIDFSAYRARSRSAAHAWPFLWLHSPASPFRMTAYTAAPHSLLHPAGDFRLVQSNEMMRDLVVRLQEANPSRVDGDGPEQFLLRAYCEGRPYLSARVPEGARMDRLEFRVGDGEMADVLGEVRYQPPTPRFNLRRGAPALIVAEVRIRADSQRYASARVAYQAILETVLGNVFAGYSAVPPSPF